MKTFMGIDQYGQTYHDLGKYPRKELLKRLYRKGASKMYQDKNNGDTVHTGYVVGGLWITLYEVTAYEGKTQL